MSSAPHNPWVALDVTANPVAHARRLRRVHERTLAGGSRTTGEVRELVEHSWTRSRVAGILPDQAAAPLRLDGDALAGARERSPLAPVVGLIHSTLSSLDQDARQVVAISDAEANLLWVTGDRETCERAREMRFEPGASWAERDVGTNAVGTATALDHPVQIFSAEHVLAAVHPWTCAAAPIHDPVSGELIGVIDLTADLRTNHPHTLSLAALAARTAEAALSLRGLEDAERLRERWEAAVLGRRTPSVLLDAYGRAIAWRGVSAPPPELVGDREPLGSAGTIVWLRRRTRPRPARLRLRLLGHDATAQMGGGEAERGLRSLELLALLAMHPEGLTTEQLALGVYGERGKAVTIRAQVHRVRAWLGADRLTANPYRLELGIEADWLDVRRLVAAGRPREALRAYRGSLLPASEAPEIVEARGLLEESLRRSILTSEDAELLAAWLDHPAGAHDLAAARTLVAVLPAGDPRRAAATARSAAIARRLG